MQLKLASTWRHLYLVLGVAWMVMVGLVLLLLGGAGRLPELDLFFWLLSLMVCAIVVGMAWFQVPLALVNRVMLGTIAAWTFTWLLADVLFLKAIRPAKVVMIDAMVALAFAFLGLRAGIALAVGSGLTLVVSGFWAPGADWELLIFNLFTLAVIGFMSFYGQEVQKARVRVEQAEALLERDQETGLHTARAAPVLLEAIAFQAARHQWQTGVVVIRPTLLPWIERQGAAKPVQHAFLLLAERLRRVCGERDVVAHWGERCLIVGIRNINQVQLETRALALQRALNGVYWFYGPAIQVEVTSVLIKRPEHLQAELDQLPQCHAH